MLTAMFGFGLIERIGYFWTGRKAVPPGALPADLPRVCVQLPMFNEAAVAERLIRAAVALDWPRDRLEIQVLDDSTEPDTRDLVRDLCARLAREVGVNCRWLHRTDRTGYKAGALEAGRRLTDARFIAILDADFLPPPDFLRRAVAHFYTADGQDQTTLGLVQTQWGHLNDEESFLTASEALWVDDHHTLQQSWRSGVIGFVNFTGTAGVWRASTIEAVGGWRSASLVEDCELSIRALFSGFRTRFVKEVVVPAELPQTLSAYRLQQKRWTQGWAQLQRLHLTRLIGDYPATLPRKLYLIYFMCISWQWPLWGLWILTLPFLIEQGLWLGSLGVEAGMVAYLLPPLGFAIFAGVLATFETRATYAGRRRGPWSRLPRILPYLVVNTGMLPLHVAAFLEGLFGPLHSEFERTPKTASVAGQRRQAGAKTAGARAAPALAQTLAQAPTPRKRRKSRLPALALEVFILVTQVSWFVLFVSEGRWLASAGAAWIAVCILTLRLAPTLANAGTGNRFTGRT